MNLETEITCPECEAEFELGDVEVWHVCLTCGKIWLPGEEWHSHHLDDSVDCGGVHAVRKYSEEEAENKSEEIRAGGD